MCWECWDDQLTEESDSMFDDLMQERTLFCGLASIVDMKTMKAQQSAITGSLRDDEVGDSGDNQDSEDLFFDDEGIQELWKFSNRVL